MVHPVFFRGRIPSLIGSSRLRCNFEKAGCGATLRKQVAGQLCSGSLRVGGTVTKRVPNPMGPERVW